MYPVVFIIGQTENFFPIHINDITTYGYLIHLPDRAAELPPK
jgi:hypothetical protein